MGAERKKKKEHMPHFLPPHWHIVFGYLQITADTKEE